MRQQCFPNANPQCLKRNAFLLKLHFTLRRRNIHINPRRFNFNVKGNQRESSLGCQVSKRLVQSNGQGPTFHRTSVHVQILKIPSRLCDMRWRNVANQPQTTKHSVNWHQRSGGVPSPNIRNRFQLVAAPIGENNFLTVVS